MSKEATRVLEAGVAGQVFPGGAATIAWRPGGDEPTLVSVAGGQLSRDGGRVQPDTPYDLGAITMALVATAALRLSEQGRIRLDVRLEEVLSDVRGSALADVTLGALLAHDGGLASWGGLYLDVPHDLGSPAARRWLVAEAARRPDDGGGRARQPSDLGYLLVGELLVRHLGEPLDRLVARLVTEPLGLADALYFPASLPADRKARLMRTAAPTERCEWRGRVVRGEPQDENCTALGGVAGHAGMFATSRALARFGLAMLSAHRGEPSVLRRETLQAALQGHGADPVRLGWWTHPGADVVGRRLSPDSFGQIGLPGTSLWIDPERGLVVALLTNRIHPSRANRKIEGFRPAFHDTVVAAFDAGRG